MLPGPFATVLRSCQRPDTDRLYRGFVGEVKRILRRNFWPGLSERATLAASDATCRETLEFDFPRTRPGFDWSRVLAATRLLSLKTRNQLDPLNTLPTSYRL